jgi:hypothetical protein
VVNIPKAPGELQTRIKDSIHPQITQIFADEDFIAARLSAEGGNIRI